jgi:glutamate formiminotransferase/formiminotetrahydrofolate cyclodeaminase
VQIAAEIAQIGNENALSDAGVAAINANAAAKSAYLNVKINMAGIDDKKFKFATMGKADELLEKVNNLAQKVEATVNDKM